MNRRLAMSFFICTIGAGATAADNELTPKEKDQGWILLFDGHTPSGWLVNKTGKPLPAVNVRDDMLNPNKSGGSMIYAKDQYADFVLSCDFKLDQRRKDERCNSGIFFRVDDLKNEVETGFEIQIYDTADLTKPEKNHGGALYDIMAPAKQVIRPPGQWNHIEITADKNIVRVVLNGEKIINCDLDKYTEPGKNIDGTENKFKKAIKDFPRKGYIGIQDYGNDCWFKNIKIKVLNR